VKTVVYTFDSPATLAVASRLVDSGKISAVILQTPMDAGARLAFLRRRLARRGLVRVVDELLFQLYYRMFLRGADDRLREHLKLGTSLSRETLATRVEVFTVDSLNTAASQALLTRLAPDLVIMSSRELLRPEVLKLASIGFIGCHPGILPDFRGAYSSFWAIHAGRPDLVGLSIYIANGGIDTGPLVAERLVPPAFGVRHFKVESERLILEGTRELLEAVERAERGTLTTYTKPGTAGPLYSLVGLTDFFQALRR